MRRSLRVLAFLPILLISAPARSEDPAKALRSPDVAVRIDAVDTIRREGAPRAEELLLDAIGDRDWEVVEHAAVALGEHGGEKSAGPLMKLALTGPTIRLRLAAARALAKIDAERSAKEVSSHVGDDWAEAACDTLGILALAGAKDEAEVGIRRGFATDEVRVRVAAVRAAANLGTGARKRILEAALRAEEVSVRAAALDAIRETPRVDDTALLGATMSRKDLEDVLSRRVVAALVAIVSTTEPGEASDTLAKRALFGYELAKDGEVAARFVRLAGRLAEAPPPSELVLPRRVSRAVVDPVLTAILSHSSPTARSAAAHALGRIGTEETLDRAMQLARSDSNGRVRLHALRSVTDARGMDDEATLRLTGDRLTNDEDPLVREDAAVRLGARGKAEAIPFLVAALADSSWEVVVCAAVSLGKTGEADAVEPLRLLGKNRDWKKRGAAVAAFGHLRRTAVIPDLIAALTDKEAAVSRTAWEILKRISARALNPSVRVWSEWWKENQGKFEFIDRDKLARDAKKHGYAPTYVGVYEDLDVIVLQSRGDSIEKLLARLGIGHRLTRSGQVKSAGVHPYAVFVANCTGQIVPKDVERLQWFVRTGGYLFCSCWALTYTLTPVYGTAVRRMPQQSEILDNVIAEKCPARSPYLDKVFPGEWSRPIYVLYGSHLIEIVDHEQVEVLIDSPDCADRWGEGNLACWFRAGHGVILDSANHFDLQGLERATGLKSASDRMGYAMDHMGLDYEEVRNLAKQRIWNSKAKASSEARDLSAFRFITNFVRQKRKADR